VIKKITDFFLFSSFYIALCAVLMVFQTAHLFLQDDIPSSFFYFIFFATVCSYNFHWWLTTHSATGSERLQWAIQNKHLHLILFIIGSAGAAIFFCRLWQHWFWIGIGGLLTFLYTAPKIPQRIFIGLRKIAIGKTIFLALVWMYITTILPFAMSGQHWQAGFTWFACGRFFLIYAICILFDYRDREDDKADGIRSMITYFDERGINNLFAGSLILFAISIAMLYHTWLSIFEIVLLLVPGLILAMLYNYAKRNFSDYLYYLVLDGLMMLSAVLMLLLRI
jgi:1,4-dihydroxy-2-naphthoate octaprenyltransferase